MGRFLRFTLLAAAVLRVALNPAAAHPVAQGALDIVVRPGGIDVRARVSNEEAFVAEAFGNAGNAGGTPTMAGLYLRHGQYLAKHLHFLADGTALAGELVETTPAPNSAPDSRITYSLRFSFPAGKSASEIALRQDVLNEFVFAPGNPWEASYVVRIAREGQAGREGLLSTRLNSVDFSCDWNAAAEPSAPPKLARWAMIGAFVHHGIMHILTGYDHLLFVSSLVLATATLWDLIKVVSAFTLSHTITLTLAALHIVNVPSSIVEPMIAASIVFVALQNVLAPERSRGWTRLAFAFGFGLFHGLGFAGGLLTAMEGMAGATILTAIAAFSLGVEIGHQTVAVPLFLAMKFARSRTRRAAEPERVPLWITRIASCAISGAGMVYLVAALRAR